MLPGPGQYVASRSGRIVLFAAAEDGWRTFIRAIVMSPTPSKLLKLSAHASACQVTCICCWRRVSCIKTGSDTTPDPGGSRCINRYYSDLALVRWGLIWDYSQLSSEVYILCVYAPTAVWLSFRTEKGLTVRQYLSRYPVSTPTSPNGTRVNAVFVTQLSLAADQGKAKKDAPDQDRQLSLRYVRNVWGNVPEDGLMSVGEDQP